MGWAGDAAHLDGSNGRWEDCGRTCSVGNPIMPLHLRTSAASRTHTDRDHLREPPGGARPSVVVFACSDCDHGARIQGGASGHIRSRPVTTQPAMVVSFHKQAGAELVNQADNAAFGDSGLSYRFCAALRFIKSLLPSSLNQGSVMAKSEPRARPWISSSRATGTGLRLRRRTSLLELSTMQMLTKRRGGFD
jgi:hypothetical protein